jgi:hypothetical protein
MRSKRYQELNLLARMIWNLYAVSAALSWSKRASVAEDVALAGLTGPARIVRRKSASLEKCYM